MDSQRPSRRCPSWPAMIRREAFDIRARRSASRQSRPRLSANSAARPRPGEEAVLPWVHELRQRARVDRDDRQPAGHRGHRHQGLQLGLGRDGEHVGQPVQAGQVVVGDEPGEANPVGHAVMAGEGPQPALVGARPREDKDRAGVPGARVPARAAWRPPRSARHRASPG